MNLKWVLYHILDGVTKNESERICIEHPDFFGKFTDSEGPRT